jgi:cobalt/nickel transport protein
MNRRMFSFIILLLILLASPALAHFSIILPSDDIVLLADKKIIQLELRHLHPFEDMHLTLNFPEEFGVKIREIHTDLSESLVPDNASESRAWKINYTVRTPGDHIFYMVAPPYLIKAEERFLKQSVKVIVNALGKSDGWDKPLNLLSEIVPLTRPYGLFVGNVFQGKVMFNGEPLKNSIVEVEQYNPAQKIKVPTSIHATQYVKTNENGIFTYGFPRAGWWGFNARTKSEDMMDFAGENFPVDLSAVLWIKVDPATMPEEEKEETQ